MQDLEKELEKIGLTEKEAKVYLAGLELGAATAQQLAAKATVNRPSTYIAIESLIKRGLMSSFQKGKKRFFKSGDPGHLLFVIESKRAQLQKQADVILSISQQLKKITQSRENDLVVDLYEGPEAFSATQMLLQETGAQEVLELIRLESVRKFIPPKSESNDDVRHEYPKKFHIRSLVCSDKPQHLEKTRNVERRFISSQVFPLDIELLIIGDIVSFSTFNVKPKSLHIRGKEIAGAMRIFFNMLWQQAIETDIN